MKELFVDLAEKSYNIYFDIDFENLCDKIESTGNYKKIMVVTDDNVNRLYADEIMEKLSAHGFEASKYVLASGEQNKNMDSVLGICKACIENGLDRKSLIAAFGGGVVGDMAGFAAAIYMRGIDFIQVPTTLLSQSDSSVGGKTGVDFMNAKNILGAFHQPKLVYINTSTLKSLPKREFISGMGEVIKHGMIRNKVFFDYLKNNNAAIEKLDSSVLADMAFENCSIKADVVVKDEFENGLRADLNFGHTIGHAVEACSGFKLSHGECVGLGMLAAAYIAMKRNVFSEKEFSELENILRDYGFKTKTEIEDTEKIREAMGKDKKTTSGKIKFVLPKNIGSVYQCTDVTEEEITAAVKYIKK